MSTHNGQLSVDPISGTDRGPLLCAIRLARLIYRRMGLRRYPQHEIEDLEQEAVIAALESLHRFSPEKGELSAFLYRRIHGTIVENIRASDRWYKKAREAAENAPQSTEGDWLDCDSLDEAEAILGALGARESDMLLSNALGEELASIGQRWGVTESRVCQILKKVRGELCSRGRA